MQSLQAASCVGDILDCGMSQSEAASFVRKTGALLSLCLRGCWTIGGQTHAGLRFCLVSACSHTSHAGELIEGKRLKDMKAHSWEISGSFGEEPPLGSSNEAPCRGPRPTSPVPWDCWSYF